MPRWQGLLIGLFALGLATSPLGCSGDSKEPDKDPVTPVATKPEVPPPEGNTEPPLIEIVTPEQYAQTIARHQGKVVLVDFWATWCVPCRQYFPHTVELHEKHAADGFAAISMSFDDPDNKDEALKFLVEQRASFDNLLSKFGGESESYAAYEVPNEVIPHFKLYDRTGKLRKTFSPDVDAGKGIDPQEIDKAVAELLAEGK